MGYLSGKIKIIFEQLSNGNCNWSVEDMIDNYSSKNYPIVDFTIFKIRS